MLRSNDRTSVPQGTVLGPMLFLLFINDLPDVVSSQARLFANDSLLYRAINNPSDQVRLQEDIKSLEIWGKNLADVLQHRQMLHSPHHKEAQSH